MAAPINSGNDAATGQSPATLAATVKHMAGVMWYDMLSQMNESGMSDDTLGIGGSDFQSMFMWNLAQNDFGKYDSALTAAVVKQLGGGGAAGAAGSSAPAAMAGPVSGGAPAMAQIAAVVAAAQAGAAQAGVAEDGATEGGVAPGDTVQAQNFEVAASASTSVPAAQLVDRAKSYAQKLWPQISAAAQALGVSPVAILAQSALETGWGAAVSGNNYFGIKASPGQPGTTRPTHEVVNGVLQAQTASFRDYASPDASVADYVGVIQSGFQDAVGQRSIAGFARTLQTNGYATDQSYAAKIINIAQSPVMQQVLQSLPAQAAGQTFVAVSE